MHGNLSLQPPMKKQNPRDYFLGLPAATQPFGSSGHG